MPVPSWLDTTEYPFQSRFFETPAGKMHYIDQGAGRPIVFVHGNPAWSFEFRNVIRRLSGTFRCIAPDHIGFGLSDKPADWSYLPQAHAENLEGFLQSLNLQQATLVVGDWGGPIGLSYAIRHPDRIDHLVITNTWLWPVNRDWHFILFSAFAGGPIGRWLIRTRNFFARDVVCMAFGDRSRLTRGIHRHYLAPLDNPEERQGTWVFPEQIVGASPWLKTLWDQHPVLENKNILLAWGMKDMAFRQKELNRWKRVFPGAETIQFDDAGHFVPEEKPEELATAIRKLLTG